jgi:hypothetical protein
VNRYHRIVQDGILLHGHEQGFPKVRGDNVPVPLNHPYIAKVHLYRPDATFVSLHGKLHVFEVLDSQVHDDNLTIADIIQAYLTPNVARIVFIVPSERDQDRIQELALIVYARLVDMGVSEKDLRQVVFLAIRPSEARTSRQVADLLNEAYASSRRGAGGRLSRDPPPTRRTRRGLPPHRGASRHRREAAPS